MFLAIFYALSPTRNSICYARDWTTALSVAGVLSILLVKCDRIRKSKTTTQKHTETTTQKHTTHTTHNNMQQRDANYTFTFTRIPSLGLRIAYVCGDEAPSLFPVVSFLLLTVLLFLFSACPVFTSSKLRVRSIGNIQLFQRIGAILAIQVILLIILQALQLSDAQFGFGSRVTSGMLVHTCKSIESDGFTAWIVVELVFIATLLTWGCFIGTTPHHRTMLLPSAPAVLIERACDDMAGAGTHLCMLSTIGSLSPCLLFARVLTSLPPLLCPM